MKVIQLICIIAAIGVLVGCGQKYPESYGLYMRSGHMWVPISDQSEPCTVSEKPEFLVFDSRLTRSSEKPDVSITFQPLKWIRWNINAIVSQHDNIPLLYEKTKVGTFLPIDPSVKMIYSPIKNHPDMLIASPVAALVDGYFVLDSFGDKVICRKNVPLNPEELPDTHVLDKWSVAYDDKGGFSWAAFSGESQNAGDEALNKGLKLPKEFASLLDALSRELSAAVLKKSIPPLFAFCQKVERLDPDLYALARTQCLAVVESEIDRAKSKRDFPTAIGIGLMATNAGFASDTINAEIATCTKELRFIESKAKDAVADLRADMVNAGNRVASFTRNEYLISQDKQGIVLTDTHINYIAMTWFSDASTWMGSISQIGPTTQEGRDTYYGVKMEAVYPQDQIFNFLHQGDRDALLTKLTEVWKAWKKKWVNRLTIEVTARPHYWSEHIHVYDVPYILERISGSNDVLLADVELGSDDPQFISLTDGARRFEGRERYYDPRTPLSGVFRVKSAGEMPVTLRLRFCPVIGPLDQVREADLASTTQFDNSATSDCRQKSVVAIVDGEEITAEDVNEEVGKMMNRLGKNMSSESLVKSKMQMSEQAKSNLVLRTLLIKQALKENITVTPEETKAAVDMLSASLPQGMTMNDLIVQNGLSQEEFNRNVVLDMRVNKLLAKVADSVTQPTEDKIKKFYEESSNGEVEPESVTASHILIAVDAKDSELVKASKKTRAEEIQRDLVAGADFASTAAEKSDCPSKRNGGDLGSFTRGQMVKPFEDAAFSQRVNEIGPVVQTQFGYHIIKVISQKQSESNTLAVMHDRIAKTINTKERQVAVHAYIEKLRENAVIVYPEPSVLQKHDADMPVTSEISKPIPRLLELGSADSVPSKIMNPILDEMKKEYEGHFQVDVIDVRQYPNVGDQYGISILPVQIFISTDGKELFRHEGYFSKDSILAKWKELGVNLK